MTGELKVGARSNKVPLLFMLAIMLILLFCLRGTYLWGRRDLLDDLGMDGYRVTIDTALERGDGRCVVQVWRDGAWAEVMR